jgi:hypothetical protein
MEFFRNLLSSSGFMPDGYCYMWRPELVWLHVVSNVLIALAYFSSPFTLIYFIRSVGEFQQFRSPTVWVIVTTGVICRSEVQDVAETPPEVKRRMVTGRTDCDRDRFQ